MSIWLKRLRLASSAVILAGAATLMRAQPAAAYAPEACTCEEESWGYDLSYQACAGWDASTQSWTWGLYGSCSKHEIGGGVWEYSYSWSCDPGHDEPQMYLLLSC